MCTGHSSSTPSFTISQVTTADVDDVRKLFLEYQESLGFSLCFQNFQQELDTLPGAYAPPLGALLIARDGNRNAVGVVALRPTGEPDICEMKRLYVSPSARGTGLGHALMELIFSSARERGYRRMRLDTVPGKMDRAIEMYRKAGFVETEPYYAPPLEHVLFMSKLL